MKLCEIHISLLKNKVLFKQIHPYLFPNCMLLLLPYKSNNDRGNYKALNICPQALDKDILEAHVLIFHSSILKSFD